ncbi:hypothetical protein ACWGR4_01490 [Embleya sp. NPDC055664]
MPDTNATSRPSPIAGPRARTTPRDCESIEEEQRADGRGASAPQVGRSHHADPPPGRPRAAKGDHAAPVVTVIVPETSPVVTPSVARALLRLLVSVREQHRQGRSTGGSSTDDEASS